MDLVPVWGVNAFILRTVYKIWAVFLGSPGPSYYTYGMEVGDLN